MYAQFSLKKMIIQYHNQFFLLKYSSITYFLFHYEFRFIDLLNADLVFS